MTGGIGNDIRIFSVGIGYVIIHGVEKDACNKSPRGYRPARMTGSWDIVK